MVGRYLRTRTLRELVDPPENDRLLRAHLQARENGFGVKGKNAATSYPTADIFDCLRMTDDDYWVGFPFAPQHTEYRAERSFLVSMRLFLQHNPYIALGAKWPGSEKIHGYDPEDWHRALAVLRWHWRKHHGTRSARGGELDSRSNTLLVL